MKYFSWRPVTLAVCILAGACNQSTEVPFPTSLSENLQPADSPLVLTEPKPLHWDTISTKALVPTVFHLDFSKRKGAPYDALGFKPWLFPPATSVINETAITTRPFDTSQAPALPLKMKMQAIPRTLNTENAPRPVRIDQSPLDMQSWKIGIGNATPTYFVRDNSGFLLIGTTFGLYRFDGTRLIAIVPGANVQALSTDTEGRIWYISKKTQPTSIINVVDQKKGYAGEMEIPYNISISAPFFRDADGALWVGSSAPDAVMIRIDPASMTYRILDKKAGLADERYFQVAEDGNKNTWMASYAGIDIINPNTLQITRLNKSNGLSSDSITALTTGPDGRMWAAWPHGVDAIDMKNKKVTHYQTMAGEGTRMLKLLFDKTGQLWMAGFGGIDVLNFNDSMMRTITSESGLTGRDVLDIYDDGHGRVLLSVFNFDLTGLINIIGQYGKTAYPFGNQAIYSATEDSRGHLWIGTGEHLYAVDSARTTYWRIDSSDGLANNFIETVYPQKGKVVVTTMDGYNIFDADKNEFLRYSKPEGMKADTILSVMPDTEGKQWISAERKGIIKYDPATQVTLQLKAAGGLNSNYVIQTLQMKNKKIWVMTDGAPSVIDPVANTVQVIKNYPQLAEQGEKIIFVDSRDRIWFGASNQFTAGGLIMIEGQKISKFSVENGLSNNYISSILEHEGKIIAGTRKKINIITPPELSATKKWTIQLLNGTENLVKNANSYASDAITARGNYLWGDDGIHIIYGIKPDTVTSRCFVVGIDIMAQPVYFVDKSDSTSKKGQLEKLRWDSLAGPYNIPVNLEMPHDENVVRFHFSEMSSGRSDSTSYAYVVEGFDKNWMVTKDGHTQTYMNLDPGDYTFKVRSQSTSGKWSEPAIFNFTVRPPWYNTWWAYVIYALTAIALLRLYLQFRQRQLKKENKVLEEKVKFRTEELQESYNNVEQLGEIGRKITASLSVENIIRTAYKNVNALMDATVFGIGIYDPVMQELHFPATYENGEPHPPYSNPVNDNNRLGSICFNTGKEMMMNNLDEQYKDYIQQLPNPQVGQQPHSLIYLPLSINKKKIGVITVQSFKKNAYTDFHLYMLRNIANYTTIALENAESFNKLNQSLMHLKETQSQLIQSEKMASLGELTAGIAHEIQNPLNFVNNFSELNTELLVEMKEEIDNGNTEEAKAIAANVMENEEKINYHGKRADAIVKGMLQHSRKSSGQKEPTDINALADEYVRLSYHGLRAKDKSFNATIKTDFDPTIGKVNLISQDMGRVLLNLFNNAFYAVAEKKKESLNGYDPTLFVQTKKLDGKIQICVRDNGNGIPQKVLDKIFQPFFTTKPTGEGTGLGLSLSYDIIKVHEGELQVETKEGESTTFIISLPVNPES